MNDCSPPRKKRKLNDEDFDYVPSENEEDECSEYEPSDDPDANKNTNTNSSKKMNDEDEDQNDDVESELSEEQKNDDNDNEDENDENKPKLSNDDKKRVREIFKIIESFTASQLKSFLRNLKSLRSIDGESVFENISMTGKKDELQKRIKNNIIMIYLGQVVIQNKEKWGWFNRSKIYNETIDFDGWKLQIQQFLNLISSQSSKSKRSKSKSILNASLLSRLNACDKHQIIASLELLLNRQPNAPELAAQFEDLLPRPNLQSVFKRHDVLINAISKARPYTRYGSSGDNYCFKRCRASINTAKKAIIADGKNIMDSKEYDTCLEYLIVSSNNVKRFPVWDNASNNSAVRDLKKKLKIWYGKIKKGFGKNINDIQQKRFDQLEEFFNDNE